MAPESVLEIRKSLPGDAIPILCNLKSCENGQERQDGQMIAIIAEKYRVKERQI